ncbi:MAG: DUF2949 domain-containing protein [Synechococcales cyanobacterium RM1_1_8]|nr:DUF2949 domain-containing protein [Synechococcales cyanobacterium RM1_1_8]
MASTSCGKLVQFLREELALSPDSINMALKRSKRDPGPLQMILWRYGLITIEQLERIYDWLEQEPVA